MFKIEKSTVVLAATREISRIEFERSLLPKESFVDRWFPDRTKFHAELNERLANDLLLACSVTIGDYVELTLEEAASIAEWLKLASKK